METLSYILSIIASVLSLIAIGWVVKLNLRLSQKNSNKLKVSGAGNKSLQNNKQINAVNYYETETKDVKEEFNKLKAETLTDNKLLAEKIKSLSSWVDSIDNFVTEMWESNSYLFDSLINIISQIQNKSK